MGILGHAIPSSFSKKEYSYGNNVTRLMAKIVTHKEALALIDKKLWRGKY